MHILIIPSERYVPSDAPLQGIFQRDQAYALKRAGYYVGVISLHLRSIRLLTRRISGWKVGFRVQDDQGMPVFNFDGYGIPRISPFYRWLCLQAGRALFKKYVAQNGMPDIVHAHNALWAGVLARQLKAEWGMAYVLTEHSSAFARGLIFNAEKAYLPDTFRYADRRLVVSPSLGYALEKMVGDCVCPWIWVPNILDERFEKAVLKKPSVPYGNRPFCFLNIGSLDENKGQTDLLNAFAQQFRDNKAIQLRLGGAGPLRSTLEALTHTLNIEQNVTFLGALSREQVLAEMQACDVFVLASHYETFGVVLIEALACGKPVIATACGGPEAIVHSANGVLTPIQDSTQLGEAMATMRENVDCYDPLQIRENCIARFGEQAVVNQLVSIYRELSSEYHNRQV
ncbi:MAG: glycosyltransferase [Anaerolineae bacterium]|nr:glycosyltransferase [Anaerolineae bacterium]